MVVFVRDGDEEGALRVQEMTDGVAPGLYGSHGPEAQAVMEAKAKAAAPVAPVLESGAQPGAPEDDMPDPDAVPVPEV